MTSKAEKVFVGVLVGGLLGGLAGAIVGRFPPLTLPEHETSQGLNQSNQAFAVAGGAILGEVAGAAIALASD